MDSISDTTMANLENHVISVEDTIIGDDSNETQDILFNQSIIASTQEDNKNKLKPPKPPSKIQEVLDIVSNQSTIMTTFMDTVTELKKTVTSLTEKLTKTQNDVIQNEQQLSMMKLNSDLIEENTSLRKSVTDLTKKLSHLSWKSFKQPDQRHLLIGSSIIRDVTTDKLLNTDVICKPGGTIDTTKQVIDKLNVDYENITVVVGGNDCDAKPHVPASKIVESYSQLIDAACRKAENVTVSNICPRMRSEETREAINAVNAGLIATCSEMDSVTFVDSTSSFMLGDGTINDGYLLADGVHITKTAMNKLAKNLKLKIKNNVEGVCKNSQQQPNKKGGMNYPKPANTPTSAEHDGEGWTVIQRHSQGRYDTNRARHHQGQGRSDAHQSRNNSIRCGYCSESGHAENKCRHGQPVECYSCHSTGHKAKFCGNNC